MVNNKKKMAKKTVKQVIVHQQPAKRKMKKVKRKSPKARSAFGPVTTIDTAPISIGNTITGSKPVVTATPDGVRVRGRDYFITVDPTATTVTGWTMVAGAPITPACMQSSALKGFSNSYGSYMVHGVAFHFVTAASTSDAGSIVMYIGKDRSTPGANTSSANFLPFVLSDSHTLLGPVWKNNTAMYLPPPNWLPIDIFNDEDMMHQACGELHFYSKIGPLDSPGFVVMDYDISFRETQVNIKSLTIPAQRMKFNQVALSLTLNVQVTGNGNFYSAWATNNLLDGLTASAAPSGATFGDIYKVIINTSNATFTNTTAATLIRTYNAYTNYVVPLTDGFTFYGLYANTNVLMWYPTFDAAKSSGATTANSYYSGTTATVTFNIPAYVSLVGSASGLLLQSNY